MQHGIGRHVAGGTWSVSKVALAMLLEGDSKRSPPITIAVSASRRPYQTTIDAAVSPAAARDLSEAFISRSSVVRS